MRFIKTLRFFNGILSPHSTQLSVLRCRKQFFHSSRCLQFHEEDREYQDKTPLHKHLRDGIAILKDEIKVWKDEVIETMKLDPMSIVPGTIDKVFSFENSEKLNKWVVSCDSDDNSGYSTAELTINEFGKGLFKGVINTEVPADGTKARTGFCNIKSIRPMKSFQRDSCFDWASYTHIVFRVRGDGRPYLINLSTPGYYDITWNDIYQYVLHTRGGPYWQLTKIPFSKFVLSSKGRLQDLQCRIPLDEVTTVGLTMCDKVNGPFSLEIDYIGVEYDEDFTEEFAYEMYHTPKYVANS